VTYKVTISHNSIHLFLMDHWNSQQLEYPNGNSGNGFVMNGSIAESARFIDWHHGDSGEQKDLLQSLYDCLHNILAIGEFAIFLR